MASVHEQTHENRIHQLYSRHDGSVSVSAIIKVKTGLRMKPRDVDRLIVEFNVNVLTLSNGSYCKLCLLYCCVVKRVELF